MIPLHCLPVCHLAEPARGRCIRLCVDNYGWVEALSLFWQCHRCCAASDEREYCLFDCLSLRDVAGDAADELITSASIHFRPQLRSIDVTFELCIYMRVCVQCTGGFVLLILSAVGSDYGKRRSAITYNFVRSTFMVVQYLNNLVPHLCRKWHFNLAYKRICFRISQN